MADEFSEELGRQIQHDANWARAFPESPPSGGYSNLSQRGRRFAQQQQSLQDEARLVAQEREQAQTQQLANNKTAQGLWLGQQRMNLQFQEARHRMLLADEKARRDAELHPLKLQAEQAKFEADTRRDAATARAEEFKYRNAAREADDTNTFLDTVLEGEASGIKPHTQEYADLLTRARLKSPGMKGDYFDDIWKSTSSSSLSPEEAIANAVAKERALSQVRSEAKAPAAEIASLEKERALHARMLDRAKRIRSKATDADIIADADADIAESERLLGDVESQIRTRRQGAPTAPSTTQPAAPSEPSTDIPELTDKSQFDALPSGSQYRRGGVTYRKP